MSAKRAAMRREKKANEKDISKANVILKQHGLPPMPKSYPVVAPLRLNGLSEQEVAARVGGDVATLQAWRTEKEKEIKQACIREMQEKLDKAEEYITLLNLIASLKSLEGFRYGKAAAAYMLEHFNDSIQYVENDRVKETMEGLAEKWGLDVEFEETDLNKLLGYDDGYDWTYDYLKQHVPEKVYNRVYTDAANITKVITQCSVIWTLCEAFGFHKHPNSKGNMLDKFMRVCKEKYDLLDSKKHAATFAQNLLKEKYDVTIGWSESVQKTMELFKM